MLPQSQVSDWLKKGQADNYMQSFSDKMNCDKPSWCIVYITRTTTFKSALPVIPTMQTEWCSQLGDGCHVAACWGTFNQILVEACVHLWACVYNSDPLWAFQNNPNGKSQINCCATKDGCCAAPVQPRKRVRVFKSPKLQWRPLWVHFCP